MAGKEPGKTEDLRISGLAVGGKGLARDQEGRVVFVEGALPGETVAAVATKSKRDYWEARVERVLEPSPDRVDPACPLYGDCGGCQLMHLAPERQARAKAEALGHMFSRLGWRGETGVSPSPVAWEARNRVRLQVMGGKLGFFAAASRRLVRVSKCPAAAQPINSLLPKAAKILRTQEAAGVNSVEFLAKSQGPAWLTLHYPRGRGPGAGRAERLAAKLVSAGAAGVRYCLGGGLSPWELTGDGGPVYFQANGVVMQTFPGVFCQVNFAANHVLVEKVIRAAAVGAGTRVWDLYAGTGNFSLPLAALGAQVAAVESGGPESRVLAYNAGKHRLAGSLEIRQESSQEFLAGAGASGPKPELIVMDPPRSGAAEVMDPVASVGPRKIIYISCHPAALVRDAGALLAAGYTVQAVEAVDMFPHTGHLEVMVVFVR